MSTVIVITDTSVLINFLVLDQAALLARLRYRLASINLQLGALNHSHDDVAGLGPRVFERSQNVTQKWPGADFFEDAQSSKSCF